jgi:hypothetical protein
MPFKVNSRFSYICLWFLFLFVNTLTAQQHQKYRSLLWKISSNGLAKDSYLFGTMHAKDKKLFRFSESFHKAFAEAEKFAMEISLDNTMYVGIFNMMMADENYDIHDYLSDAEYARLDAWLRKEFGFKLSLFERIKPIFIYIMTNKASLGSGNRQFLDEYLYTLARQQGKEIIGLETIEEQVAALESISIEEQFQMILKSIDRQRQENRAYKKLLRAYLKQHLNRLYALMQQSMLSETAYRKMIDERNIIMVKRLIPLLHDHSVFVAVGAGHLAGGHGMIELLRKEGYEVAPVR